MDAPDLIVALRYSSLVPHPSLFFLLRETSPVHHQQPTTTMKIVLRYRLRDVVSLPLRFPVPFLMTALLPVNVSSINPIYPSTEKTV